MNPAIFAATTTAALAAATAQRQKLQKRLEQLPPQESTRERVLEGQPELERVLDQLLHQRLVRIRPDGTLRYDPEAHQAAARAAGKVALVVVCALVLVGATVALALALSP